MKQIMVVLILGAISYATGLPFGLMLVLGMSYFIVTEFKKFMILAINENSKQTIIDQAKVPLTKEAKEYLREKGGFTIDTESREYLSRFMPKI